MVQGLRAVVRDANFATFGVSASVTVPGGTPVETTVIPLTPAHEPAPQGNDVTRAVSRRGFALRRDEVSTVPRGTLIERGDDSTSWTVDAIDQTTDEEIRVTVVPLGS